LPARAAIISFDDGYRDNLEVALPLLLERRVPAVFFVATAFNDGSAMFNDRIGFAVRDSKRAELDLRWHPGGPIRIDSISAKVAAVERLITAVKYQPPELRDARTQSIVDAAGADAPTGLMMTPAELQKLAAAGMTIGGHTRHHPILRALSPERAMSEIQGGRSDLADLTGLKPLLFAYPNGRRGQDYDVEHIEMVRQSGYQFAFCTHPGFSNLRTDPFELRRFTPWGRQHKKFAFRALANLMA
jgi:peptidoglycan/xylan/chitin deacetylase (PgdA/CDA1 family)